MKQPNFLSKPLDEMTPQEWESICDGCGLCCQIRVEDIDSGEIVLSNVSCRYLCHDSHQCLDYANRQQNVPDCVKVTPQNIHELTWLPHTLSLVRVIGVLLASAIGLGAIIIGHLSQPVTRQHVAITYAVMNMILENIFFGCIVVHVKVSRNAYVRLGFDPLQGHGQLVDFTVDTVVVSETSTKNEEGYGAQVDVGRHANNRGYAH